MCSTNSISMFSPCGTKFIYCGSDGKFKFWEVATGLVKQEFVPNLHLKQLCSAIIWIYLTDAIDSPKSKRRKIETSKEVVIFATRSGTIAFYDLREGKTICILNSGNSSTITSISFCDKTGFLYSSSDNTICEWDLNNKSINSSWKCKNKKIAKLDTSRDGKYCLTAGVNICLWEIRNKNLVKKFIGHSSFVNNLVFVNNQYFISCGQDDRLISVWNVNTNESIGRFAVNDSVIGNISLLESNGSINIAAVRNNGTLCLFKHQLNGTCGKAIKPHRIIEIVSKDSGVNNKSNTDSNRMPIIAASYINEDSVTIVYGQLPMFTFETISLPKTDCNPNIVLVREKKTVLNSMKKKNTSRLDKEVEYVNGITYVTNSSVKRPHDQGREVSFEERLSNLSNADVLPKGDNSRSLAQLLVQGLESNDKNIIENVLKKTNPISIRETMFGLPLKSLSPFLKYLHNCLGGSSRISTTAIISWLRNLMTCHASHLLADDTCLNSLHALQSVIKAKLQVGSTIDALAGRLDLIFDSNECLLSNNIDETKLVIYQDEDSSVDENISEEDDAGIVSESDHRWDELSDDEPPDDLSS